MSSEPEPYAQYITQSRGEFTVAKDQNVRLRSGWFSDRSATYLASGRPVITQDTGFGNILPTGRGLFRVLNDEGRDPLGRRDQRRLREAQPRGARDRAGVFQPTTSCWEKSSARWARDDDHVRIVVRAFAKFRRLSASRTHRARSRSDDHRPRSHAAIRGDDGGGHVRANPRVASSTTTTTTSTQIPPVSIVLVTHNNLVFTKLCVLSLLAYTPHQTTS
jgi:hypothetical protein